MIDYSQKPSQFELFPGESSGLASIGKPRSPLKDLTISPENIIVWTIVLVMTFVLAFSFGVERGKGIKPGNLTAEKTAEKINFEDKQQDAIIVAPASAGKAPLKVKDKIVVSKDSSSKAGAVQSATKVTKEQAAKKDVKATATKDKQSTDGHYTIQVASFKLKDRATQEAKQLEKIGHEIFVLSKGSYSVVCVGKFEEKKQADKLSQKLKGRYRDLVLRRL